ncbi:MAG: hypothetical protein HKN90_01350 [Flavobacteriaceae bacterium]|nr:hypothetical protein [Flavobacteriaceae bacterium]
MKRILYLFLCIPLLALTQSPSEYAILENGLINANPAKIKEFETNVAAHNKKYHTDAVYGARVYWISNGKNIGKYMWVMGPLPWSALDSRPAQEGHDEDWNTNVLPYVMAEGGDQTYWRFRAELSNFPKDFVLKNVLVDMYDTKRFKDGEVMALMKKIQKVMTAKYPNETYGIYTNELASMTDGRDLAYVSFFDKSAWMGEDSKFAEKYNEVHGEGSFAKFLEDWEAVSHGKHSSEIWVFREDLSGLSGTVSAVERQ